MLTAPKQFEEQKLDFNAVYGEDIGKLLIKFRCREILMLSIFLIAIGRSADLSKRLLNLITKS